MADELTPEQRKSLRGMANTMKPVVIIGKEGITDAVAARASEALEAHELIKCQVLDTDELPAREAADHLAARLNAQCVQVIGKRFSLYRRSHRKDIKHLEF